jgi:hypothetical protein
METTLKLATSIVRYYHTWSALYFVYIYVVVVMYVTSTGTLPPMVGTTTHGLLI